MDDRTLILALDFLYRESMKFFEKETLLAESRKLLDALALTAIDAPVEGYYCESEELKEYFLNIKTLQQCPMERKREVECLEPYRQLSKVMSSEIFGSGKSESFLPQRLDPLYEALQNVPVGKWTVEKLTSEAHAISRKTDDISLVGIAASIHDAVVLTALRESVALYGVVAAGCATNSFKFEYKWNVTAGVKDKVNRFISTFNELTLSTIKEAEPDNIVYFHDAFAKNDIMGRCIYIGYDDTDEPIQRYHWAINYDAGRAIVDAFWSNDLWTTERYQKEKCVFKYPNH